ncbi:hypothetical protein NE237_017151 [Protea cynaroides]|uniref:Uncharacterized protein n=1 Tax=Protea cynaroides TaxID=273540 RepID=A0A9Q0K7H1_9MAGN|nr:hypothetical protein NE237_017151 [Protea cynaroides]
MGKFHVLPKYFEKHHLPPKFSENITYHPKFPNLYQKDPNRYHKCSTVFYQICILKVTYDRTHEMGNNTLSLQLKKNHPNVHKDLLVGLKKVYYLPAAPNKELRDAKQTG